MFVARLVLVLEDGPDGVKGPARFGIVLGALLGLLGVLELAAQFSSVLAISLHRGDGVLAGAWMDTVAPVLV